MRTLAVVLVVALAGCSAPDRHQVWSDASLRPASSSTATEAGTAPSPTAQSAPGPTPSPTSVPANPAAPPAVRQSGSTAAANATACARAQVWAAFNATRAFLSDMRGTTFSVYLDGVRGNQSAFSWQAFDPAGQRMALRGVEPDRDDSYNGSLHLLVQRGQDPLLLHDDGPGGSMRSAYLARAAQWASAHDDLHALRWHAFGDFAAMCIQDAGALEVRFQSGNATSPVYRLYVVTVPDGRLRSIVVRNQTSNEAYSAAFAYGAPRIDMDILAQRVPGQLDGVRVTGTLPAGLGFAAGTNTTRLHLGPGIRVQVLDGPRILNDTALAPGTLQVGGGTVTFADVDGDGLLGPGDAFEVQLPNPESFRLFDAWAGAPFTG